jgi:hypothetical protein
MEFSKSMRWTFDMDRFLVETYWKDSCRPPPGLEDIVAAVILDEYSVLDVLLSSDEVGKKFTVSLFCIPTSCTVFSRQM